MVRKLLIIAGKDPREEQGGHSSYVRAHARAAQRLGFEPHLFCAGRRSAVAHTDYGWVHCAASPFRPFRAAMSPLQGPLIAARVKKFLGRAQGRCLVHSFGLVWGGLAVALSRRLKGRGPELVPVVSAYTTFEHEISGKLRGLNGTHGTFHKVRQRLEHAWARALVVPWERLSCHGSRLVLVNYDSVRRLIVDRHGLGAPIIKLPYTSETAFLQPSDRSAVPPDAIRRLAPADAPLIVAVSRQDPRKGVDVLLRALARLRKAGIHFRACLIGGGSLLAAHRALARRLGLDGAAVLEGFVADPRDYLRHADLFVLPSIQEGSGSVSLIEALQAGVPVVASNLDGIPEDIADGHNGLLAPPGDAEALAQAMARALTDGRLRHTLARHSRETFSRRFSPEAFAQGLASTYAQLGF